MKVTPFENHGFLEDVNFTWYPQNMHYNLYTKNKQLVKQATLCFVGVDIIEQFCQWRLWFYLNLLCVVGVDILTYYVLWLSISWLWFYFDLLCVVGVNIIEQFLHFFLPHDSISKKLNKLFPWYCSIICKTQQSSEVYNGITWQKAFN